MDTEQLRILQSGCFAAALRQALMSEGVVAKITCAPSSTAASKSASGSVPSRAV